MTNADEWLLELLNDAFMEKTTPHCSETERNVRLHFYKQTGP